MSDTPPPLHQDMDAERWAKDFIEINGGDLDTMRAWFANAIMCGYDNANWRNEEKVTGLMGYLTAAVPELHQMHPDALNQKRKEYDALP